MSPEVYMCYLISVRHGDFKQLIRRWNSEFKTYDDEAKFRAWKNKMVTLRRTHKSDSWSNFNVERLFNFVREHLYWGEDE
jgi:hypothetical protein